LLFYLDKAANRCGYISNCGNLENTATFASKSPALLPTSNGFQTTDLSDISDGIGSRGNDDVLNHYIWGAHQPAASLIATVFGQKSIVICY
jgi:hypothetical protein